MKKIVVFRKKLKKGVCLPFLKNLIICPGSVVADHPSLSSSGLGFKSRLGRFIKSFLRQSIKDISKEKYKSSTLLFKGWW